VGRNVRVRIGYNGNPIASGAEYDHLDFTNLTSGQSITSMVSYWGTQGTGADSAYGCFGDTTVKRTGKNSSLRLSIKQGSTGRPGDGAAVTEGDYGFGYNLPAKVNQGGTVRVGAWVRIPTGWSWAPTGGGKFLRLLKCDSGGSPTGRKVETFILNGTWISGPDDEQYGWLHVTEGNDQLEAETKHQADSTVFLQEGVWHWVESYVKCHSDGSLSERRWWVDNILTHEIIGNALKYRNSSGTYSTQTWSGGIPTIETSDGGIDEMMFLTYWNGGAPQDQSFYLSELVISNNNEDASDLATDAFGNKMIGNAHV
jgi:hypothetical protein